MVRIRCAKISSTLLIPPSTAHAAVDSIPSDSAPEIMFEKSSQKLSVISVDCQFLFFAPFQIMSLDS